MNKRYIYLAVVALTNMAFATAQQAAKDSTLNREMLIEKEFIPIIKDANKISKLPEVEQITVSKAPAIYSIATFTAVPEPEISPLSVGDINNAYPFSNKRGYANLSLGNYRSATFDVGYRILDTKTNILGVYYNLNVSRAKLHYLDEEGKTKQKIADNAFKIYYKHNFSDWSLNTDLAYDMNFFNYYGFDKTTEEMLANTAGDYELNQTQNRLKYNIGFKTETERRFNQYGKFGMVYFADRHPRISETSLIFEYGFNTELNDQTKFILDASLIAQMYGGSSDEHPWPMGLASLSSESYWKMRASYADLNSNINKWETSDYYKNSGVFRLTPGVYYTNNEELSIKGGINVDIAYGPGPKFGVSPVMNLIYKIDDNTSFYGDAMGGGISTFSLSNETYKYRYLLTPYQAKNSYTIMDLTIGVRSDKAKGFYYDVFAGIGYTVKERFVYSSISAYQDEDDAGYRNGISNINSLMMGNRNSMGWKIGTLLRYETGIFSSGLSAVYSDRSDEYVQSGRSKFDLGVDIAVMATEKLRLEVDYNLYAGRKMHIVETNSVTKKETDGSETSSINIVPFNKNLKSINEFNFKASYVFNDMFTAYFLLNNLFNQKYDLWYGMPMQHINFRLGCNVNF